MRILLLSDMPPCENYTAGIVLNRLCDFLLEEGHEVCCFTIKHPDISATIPPDKADRIKYRNTVMPRENWGHTRLGWVASFVMNNFSALFLLPSIAKNVAEFIKEQNCDIIWGVIQGQATIRIIRQAAKFGTIPYVVQAWDPSEWWMDAMKFDKITQKLVMREYARLMRNSKYFISPSWAMAENYKKRYGMRSSVVLPGLEIEEVESERPREGDDFIIAFAGQMYALDEMMCLLDAVKQLGGQYNEKRIIIRIYGDSFPPEFHQLEMVEDGGWLPQPELIKALTQADILYCPYGFSKGFKRVAMLSFPSKLVVYFKARKPVLFHGPDYSSPFSYLKNKDAAYCCTELSSDALRNMIKRIIDDPNKQEVIQRGYQAFCSDLSVEAMKRNFFKAFNLPMKYPIPSPKFKVVEVNNIDLTGRRFNGHDLQVRMNQLGIAAKQFVLDQEGCDPNTKLLGSYCNRVMNRPLYQEFEKKASMHDLLYPYGWDLMDHTTFREADVVHYHLIHNYLIALPILKELTRIKPSIWTIHDPWVFSGHCIYSLGCNQWRTGCNNCSNLSTHFSMQTDKASQMWEVKKSIFQQMDVDIIVASQYMKRLVEESPLTCHFNRVHWIPFGVDLKLFSNFREKDIIRRKLGIPRSNFVMFFRSDNSIFKGLDKIKQMLERLRTTRPVTLLTVGQPGLLKEFYSKYSIQEYGWVNDNEKLANLYTACDVFLMPSTAEAFGLMAIEAMASGKSVIVAEGTSLPDVTFAPECGISFAQGDIQGFTDAVERLINNPDECQKRGQSGRLLAEKYYNIDDHFTRMVDLYEEVYNRGISKKRAN